MICTELETRLADLVEDRLDPALSKAAGDHLRQCAACRREVDGLRRLIAEARSLPASVDPLTDLWPSIERRLTPQRPARGRRFDWRTLAVAATLAVAFVAAGLALRPRESGALSNPVVATGAPAATTLPATETSDPPRFDAAEQALLETKQRLREALAERRSTLSPATVAVVDRNIGLIEQAIEEIRVALEADPANPQLNRMLLAAHQQELALLQRVTQHGRPL